MVGYAVAHCFDQDRLAAVLEGHFARFFGDFAHGEDVVAVHADRINAIADSTAGNTVAAVLLECRGRDGVAVVTANEDDGAGACCCDVERGVEIPLAGGALAEVTGTDSGHDVGILQ